jgi:ubiquinone/menaquinone biosynthesis C-methylase UbiE
MKTGGATSMFRESGTRETYDHILAPLAFDVLIRGIFAPLGGIGRVRARALDLLDLRPGQRVLELGCGTGDISRLLLERGVSVTAIDASQRMLSRARRRAPGAQFHCCRLEEFQAGASYDRVLFAFVLHELSEPERHAALCAARRALAPGGILAFVDWSLPSATGMFRQAWRWFLLRLESQSVINCLDQGYEAELLTHGLRIVSRDSLAAGTVQIVLTSQES